MIRNISFKTKFKDESWLYNEIEQRSEIMGFSGWVKNACLEKIMRENTLYQKQNNTPKQEEELDIDNLINF